MDYMYKILAVLTKKDKAGLILIAFLSIVKTIIEIAGIGLLIPILSILSNSVIKNQFLFYFPFLKEFNEIQILLFFIILFIFFYIVRTSYIIFLNILSSKYYHNLYANLAEKLLKKYLNNKFIFFVQNNPASLVANIATETNGFAIGSVASCVTIFSNLIFFLAICSLSIFYNYNFIFVIIILFFACTVVVYFSKKKFTKWGQLRYSESVQMVKKLNELIGSIKEVILYNKKDFFVNQITQPIRNFSKASVYKDSFTSITSPFIEFVTVIVFFIFFFILIFHTKKNFDEIIIILGICSYSSIRVLPNLIAITRSIQLIKFNFPSINIIYDNLIKSKNEENFNRSSIQNINKIVFQKVDFTYPQKKNPILENVNFKISSGDKVGIIGETGSGKTTLVNLMSGLLIPTNGKIIINSSKVLNSRKFSLNIGYVSQSVYIADDNILFNITLSDEIANIKINVVSNLLKALNLNNFNNKKNINKTLGNQGLKMSGGQIQRIGIARALYRQPSLLILDEATNSLDEKTENKILDYLFKEFKDKIIIFCTHKKKLLKYCNKIIEVKNRKIILGQK